MRIVEMLKYPFISGFFFPFKIYHASKIKIKQNSSVQLGSRITLGTPDSKKAIISRLPINLYFGKNSKIIIGDSISIGAGVNIIVKDNATFKVGDNTYFTSDMHIEVVNSLEIGCDCAISWGTTIIDDDHHQLISESLSAPVNYQNLKVGNHVWIGCNVTILKGSQIGNNCIIAAGSVLKGTFPDNTLIAGNPAKIVKQNVNWK